MTLYVFDTGPLSAFARVGRISVLAQRFAEHAWWTVEVQAEIDRGVGLHPRLADIAAAGFLGDPIGLTDPEDLHEMELVRWALGGNDRYPHRHRGEAATILAAERREAVAVLDDRDARTLAARRGIPISGTEGILRSSARDGSIAWDDAWQLYREMRRTGVWLRDLSFEEFCS